VPRFLSQKLQSAAPPAMVPSRYGLISMIFLTVPEAVTITCQQGGGGGGGAAAVVASAMASCAALAVCLLDAASALSNCASSVRVAGVLAFPCGLQGMLQIERMRPTQTHTRLNWKDPQSITTLHNGEQLH
jgi:hypothetical protein